MFPANIDLKFLNSFQENNLTGVLGIEIIGFDDKSITGKMPVNENTRQPFGLLHGGASAAFSETITSLASNVIANEHNCIGVGLEINANHIAGIREGFVIAKATLLHKGKSTHVWDVKINDESSNRLISVSRMTIAIIPKKS